MPRTNIYIDGFNLYYGSLKRTPYKWLNVEKLCQLMLPTDLIQSIKFFTANVSARPHDLHLPIRQQIYFRALKTIPNLTLIYGHFLTHSVPYLAAHLLHDGFNGLFDTAVIISNDSDLAEPVRLVKQVLNLPVGILNPHQRHSQTLQQYATFVKRIRQHHLIASQFPNPMTDSKGVFHKPQGW